MVSECGGARPLVSTDVELPLEAGETRQHLVLEFPTPLLVSEWGGFGFPMYGGPTELHARPERIRTFKA